MRKATLATTLVFGILGIVIGVLFAFLANLMLNIIFIVCGVLTLLAGIPQLVSAIMGLIGKEKAAIFDLVMSVITVIVGIMLIVSRNQIVMIIVGAYLVIFPIVRTLIAKDKVEQLKKELLSIIIGVALMILGPGAAFEAFNIIAQIAGIVIVVLSVLYIVFGIVTYLVSQKKAEDVGVGTRVFADTNGDGNIDTVYVDTTGDGKVDTEIKINKIEENE